MKNFRTALLFMLGAMVQACQAQFPTTNLLINPGAEMGDLTGWTVGGDSNPSVDNGSFDGGINPRTGTYDFYGHNGDFGTLNQTINLVGKEGITTNMIDTGGLLAQYSFWEQGLNQGTPSDHAAVSLTLLDAAFHTNAIIVSRPVDSHDLTWKSYASAFWIPPGTRYVQYTMEFIRSSGSDNDSFIDDNVFSISTASVPVSDPPSLVAVANPSLATVFWLSPATGYVLETTTNLINANWQTVTNVPVVIGLNQVVGVPAGKMAFFRLHKTF